MKTLKFLFVAMLLVIGISSCSNKIEADKVAEKIEKGEALTQGDYTCIIDYLGYFAKEAQPIQDKINNLADGAPEADEFVKQLDKLKADNPHIDLFNSVLGKASQSELGAENVALVDKYAGYEWFTSPSWAEIQTDPEAAGIEVQTPDNDTSGVVAGAVDELQVKEY